MSHLICGLDVIFLTVINEIVMYPWNLGLFELFILTSFFHIIVSDILSENIYVHTQVGIDDQYRPHYIIIPSWVSWFFLQPDLRSHNIIQIFTNT